MVICRGGLDIDYFDSSGFEKSYLKCWPYRSHPYIWTIVFQWWYRCFRLRRYERFKNSPPIFGRKFSICQLCSNFVMEVLFSITNKCDSFVPQCFKFPPVKVRACSSSFSIGSFAFTYILFYICVYPGRLSFLLFYLEYNLMPN